jgi:hypothetical protein
VVARRLSIVALLALTVAACVARPAPTPVEPPTGARPTSPPTTPAPTARPTPVATQAPTERPARGFFFRPSEIVDYYELGVGFACEPWAAAAAAGHRLRICRLADATNPSADQAITLTIDPDGALADILAAYVHRDGTVVDRDAAMRFFATVLGASFGGDDGQTAVTWLTGNLGAPSAIRDLRGLRFGTFLSDLPEDRGSALFVEIATPAFTATAG